MKPNFYRLALILVGTSLQASLLFEPNRGQTDAQAQFLARTKSGAVFFTSREIIFQKPGVPVRLSFAGASESPWHGLEPSGNPIHYMLGRDRSRWIDGLQPFRKLIRKDLYPGIDLVVYGNGDGRLEYDLIVAPGADPAKVRIRTSEPSTIDRVSGDLRVGSSIIQKKPIVFQGSKSIAGEFRRISAREFGFSVAAYDHAQPLTIDPVIESREYIGGDGDDSVTSVTSDGQYASGTTSSIDFPGSPVNTHHGKDVFYRSPLGVLIFGGSGDEIAATINIQGRSSSIETIAGTTTSRDLPVGVDSTAPSLGYFEQTQYFGGASDGFILRVGLNYRGVASYFGTPGEDRIVSIAMDNGSNSLVLAGWTNGDGLPAGYKVSPQPQRGGGFDAFVVQGSWFNRSTFLLAMTTYLGGSGDDFAYAISGPWNAFAVAGETFSADFPVTAGAAQTQRKGASDAFITRYAAADVPSIYASTLFGGDGFDRIEALVLAGLNYACTGTTSSTNLPGKTAGSVYGGGESDAFFTQLFWQLSQVQESRTFGGSAADEGLAIAWDEIYKSFAIGGRTRSSDFPMTAASQAAFGGGDSDGFVIQLDGAATVHQSTYLGGSGADAILAIPSFAGPSTLVAGATTSPDLPGGPALTPVNPRTPGNRDGFIAKVSRGVILAPDRIISSRAIANSFQALIGDGAKLDLAGSIRAKSNDSSLAAVSFAGADAVADVTWPVSASLPLPPLTVRCLQDSGTTTVTLSALGYADRTVQVICGIAEFSLSGRPSGGAIEIDGSTTLPLAARITTSDPAVEAFGFASLLPAKATVANSDPSTLSIQGVAQPQAELPFPGFPQWNFAPLRYGSATVTISAADFKPATYTIRIPDPALAPPIVDVAAGFTRQDSYSGVQFGATALTSTAPSQVQLFNSGGAPSATISLNSYQYSLQGAPGTPLGTTVNIQATSPSGTSIVRVARFVAPALALTNGVNRSFKVGAEGYIGVTVATPFFRTLGLPALPVSVVSSNPAVFAVEGTDTAAIGEVVAFKARAVSEGTAILTLVPPTGFTLLPGRDTIRVTVTSADVSGTLTLADFDLGKDLTARRTVGVPSGFTGALAITTTTPNLISLSVSGNTVTLSGLASSGEGKIVVQAAGYPTVTATVRLRPTAMIFERGDFQTTASGLSQDLRILPAAVDPVSGTVLEVGSFRAGVTAPTVTVQNSNAAVATYDSSAFRLVPIAVGTTTLSLQQPAGFASTTQLQRALVTVGPFNTVVTGDFVVQLLIKGSGTVDGFGACATNPCAKLFNKATTFTLKATPNAGFRFAGWTGFYPCPDPTCVATVSDTRAITANFVPMDNAMHFVPLPPCRLVDTRTTSAGPIAGNTKRNFPLRSLCSIPANAAAYSLNVTAVPRTTLGFLSIWPGGQTQPVVSTLNALDGRIKANAAIVPAGTDGSVDVYVTDAADVILDVNGVFVPAGSNTAGKAFYPIAPCRVLDTRTSIGPVSTTPVTIPLLNATSCSGAPGANPTAAVVNVTAIPKQKLGFLTLWPGALANRPVVSTLNALTGAVTANLAIVPDATSVNAYATDATDLVVDVLGYFGTPNLPGALNFYPLTPCRLLDSRTPDSPLTAQSTRDVAPGCAVPTSGAKAYSVSATVLPSPGILGFLTLYATGAVRPLASTLNAVDGSLTSNAAFVPAGIKGSIAAYVTERTHLILDINGYFAP